MTRPTTSLPPLGAVLPVREPVLDGLAVGRVAGGSAGTLGQRATARVLAALVFVASRLPEGLLVPLAEAAGELWYRVAPERAARARRNLRRVCAWAAAHDQGSPRTRAAATDPAILERIVRACFRHQARYYLELARIDAIGRDYLRERLFVETPEVVATALADPAPMIFVGLHFGAIEIPALVIATTVGRATAPMETIENPPLQRYFAEGRMKIGLRLVTIDDAHKELTDALGRGEPVGLIVDRDLTGNGHPVELFGAPTPQPIGGALLAIESGAPLYFAEVHRLGVGRYAGSMAVIDVPKEGRLRARIDAVMASVAREAERVVVAHPEQWWAAFFPIWPDLEEPEA